MFSVSTLSKFLLFFNTVFSVHVRKILRREAVIKRNVQNLLRNEAFDYTHAYVHTHAHISAFPSLRIYCEYIRSCDAKLFRDVCKASNCSARKVTDSVLDWKSSK